MIAHSLHGSTGAQSAYGHDWGGLLEQKYEHSVSMGIVLYGRGVLIRRWLRERGSRMKGSSEAGSNQGHHRTATFSARPIQLLFQSHLQADHSVSHALSRSSPPATAPVDVRSASFRCGQASRRPCASGSDCRRVPSGVRIDASFLVVLITVDVFGQCRRNFALQPALGPVVGRTWRARPSSQDESFAVIVPPAET